MLTAKGLRKRYKVEYNEVSARPIVAERLAKLTNLPAGQKPQAPDYNGLSVEEELVLRLGYELSIINHSPGGYCLSWPREVPAQLQAGDAQALAVKTLTRDIRADERRHGRAVAFVCSQG